MHEELNKLWTEYDSAVVDLTLHVNIHGVIMRMIALREQIEQCIKNAN